MYPVLRVDLLQVHVDDLPGLLTAITPSFA